MKRLALILGALFITLGAAAYFVVDHPWAWNTTAPLAAESVAGPSIDPASLEITYIANEGVLISSGDKQVLIDGLAPRISTRLRVSATGPTGEDRRRAVPV